MAAKGMIEPFAEGQVRTDRGRKIVSYGTSSYGYDVRCAQEFKIFTNINSTIVDPKNFDPKNFVDFEGEVCIVPPNSFVLARTVEYFRIPRNVLTVCLGKCVTGDTRVVDAETGAFVPITEMRWGSKTLGMEEWQLKSAVIAGLIPQGERPVLNLRTRSGLRIRATTNHPFLTLQGWVPLGQLNPGTRIAVARHIPVFGKTSIPEWEASLLGLMISEGQCNTPGHSPTFTSADPVLVQLLEAAVAAAELGTVTYNGRYGYRLVNRKGRGGIPEASRSHRWLQRHRLNVGAEGKFVPQAIFMAPRELVRLFLQALFSGDGGLYHSRESLFLEYYSKSRRLIEDVHHLLLRFGVFSLVREKVTTIGTNAYWIQITDRDQIQRYADTIGFVPDCAKQQRLETEILPRIRERPRRRSNFDTLPNELWLTMRGNAQLAGISLRSIGVRPVGKQSVSYQSVARLATATSDPYLHAIVDGPVWDVVESIEPAGSEPVFDISVPRLHNFVANDLIVHNSTYARCGLIVNVTPLEPEWEGHVTLEFSNTTPLPARIYANEGVAQMLFFESDEVCETSYRDRGGKYQGQKGVTLPRT
jgi:deoxycytidine triphosphate deaminase/intein/homing endonuclease